MNLVASQTNIILQEPEKGMYCSELLNGKYQIIQSKFYDNKYYVFDHSANKWSGAIIRSTKSDGFQIFNSVTEAEVFLGISSESNPEKTANKPAKGAKVTKSAPKKKERGQTAFSLLKHLIVTTEMSDKEIADAVKAKYPNSTYTNHLVKYNRKKLVGG